jgi:release factor glutamine methyltransferase
MSSSNELLRKVSEKLEAVYDKQEAQSMAFLLLENLFLLSRSQILAGEEIADPEKEKLLYLYIERLLQSEPIQYIIGHTEFYGNQFEVNPSVLIPRPETEELVDLVISENKNLSPLSIVDIGTGSGCIPISLKKALPLAEVFAVDISDKALVTAKRNASLNKVEITFLEKNILLPESSLPSATIIVSNPPYVMEKEKKQMQKNVLGHEPHLALFVDNRDPLVFYRVITEKATKYLLPGGKLYFEINEQFGNETADLLIQAGFKEVKILKDLNGKDRIVRGKKNQ